MLSKKLFNKAVHSSKNHTWKTPEYVFNYLDEEFEFTFDPCPIGRIKFVGAVNSAPFPSMIVFFGPKQKFSTPKISMVVIPRQ